MAVGLETYLSGLMDASSKSLAWVRELQQRVVAEAQWLDWTILTHMHSVPPSPDRVP